MPDGDYGTYRHDGGRWGFVMEGMHENKTLKIKNTLLIYRNGESIKQISSTAQKLFNLQM